ncbi:MAG: hypothetical protein GY838_15060 [bacterium]|nr:hypothetical protein [bacterium]
MHHPGFRRLPALLPLLLLLTACGDDDDPARPDPSPWQEVELPAAASDTRTLAVDFNGDHGLALTLSAGGGPLAGDKHGFYGLQPDGSWSATDLGDIRAAMATMDLAVDADGGVVLAGMQYSGPPSVVLDLRGPAAEYIEQSTYGMLTVACEGSFMVAGGRATGGGLWSSTAPGVWHFDGLPLTGTNDSGFRDIDIRGGTAVACGYDDGADTLQVILTRTAGTDWTKIVPGGPYAATYLCIAQADDGTIYLGGMDGAGGPSPQAFLSQRTPDGTWTDLDLPDPAGLHGIRDILVAADGSLYLACYGEMDQTQANLVHGSPTSLKKEITPFSGGFYQIDQAADGTIYAVGFRRNGQTGLEEGVMMVRSP